MLNLVRELGALPMGVGAAIHAERSILLRTVDRLSSVEQIQVLDALGIFIDSNRAQNLTILELQARLKGTHDLLIEKAKVIRSLAYQLEQSAQ